MENEPCHVMDADHLKAIILTEYPLAQENYLHINQEYLREAFGLLQGLNIDYVAYIMANYLVSLQHWMYQKTFNESDPDAWREKLGQNVRDIEDTVEEKNRDLKIQSATQYYKYLDVCTRRCQLTGDKLHTWSLYDLIHYVHEKIMMATIPSHLQTGFEEQDD
jgi:hypothetical protein